MIVKCACLTFITTVLTYYYTNIDFLIVDVYIYKCNDLKSLNKHMHTFFSSQKTRKKGVKEGRSINIWWVSAWIEGQSESICLLFSLQWRHNQSMLPLKDEKVWQTPGDTAHWLTFFESRKCVVTSCPRTCVSLIQTMIKIKYIASYITNFPFLPPLKGVYSYKRLSC